MIIKNNNNVLDIGCFPGGWVQYCLEIIGDGKITGIDLKDVAVKSNKFKFYNMDVYDKIVFSLNDKFDVVLSDLAPRTTGIKDLDRHRSFELAKRALEIAKRKLKVNGNFLVKIFQSDDFIEYLNECKKYFRFVKCDKPLASKKKSVEMYIVCMGFKGL